MDNFDLAAALRHYRECERLSLEEIAGKLNVSRSAYYRLESGAVTPDYKKAQEIRKLLKMEDAPAIPEKWYKSKKMRWIRPIIIAFLFFTFLTQTAGFQDGYGKNNLNDQSILPFFIMLGAAFCALYWYYYPPEWPLKKNRK